MTAYAAPLPNGVQVVVRHNTHGGLLAPMTGDRFLPPTRAPHELAVSLRLQGAGVPTPTIVAYAVYRAGPVFRRSDVASLEIRDGADLAAILTTGSDSARRQALDAAAVLIGQLARCGARHHDINLKNVLLAPSNGGEGRLTAFVLDVDRVDFGSGSASVAQHNLQRFRRSARKWRDLHGARVDEADLERVAATVAAASSASPTGTRASTRS